MRARTKTGIVGGLTPTALDERVAIVGTSGSGKTYAAKGLVELLLTSAARICVVDPLGVWWGLRSSADGITPGFPVIVFGGRHADVPLDEGMGAALGRVVGTHESLACVVDVSELGSSAARRRFMSGFAESLYESNTEPLHLVMDESDLWAPQRPLPEANALLGRIEEIVRRGRVRGFIPWLITQRPAVVHKDVLSQADILICMKLTSSQDRDAIGGWIEGQADRAEGKRILGELPRLQRGEGFLWAPSDGVLTRVAFPKIRTFDSSRTPRRGERIATPRTLADVDLSAIVAALAATNTEKEAHERKPPRDDRRVAILERDVAAARDRVTSLESENRELRAQLDAIGKIIQAPPSNGALGKAAVNLVADLGVDAPARVAPKSRTSRPAALGAGDDLHPAARKLLAALAQHAPARFTWGQAATLAGLKPTGGHYNAGRKTLRDAGYIEEADDLVSVSSAGLEAAGDVPPATSSAAERLAMWCGRLPSPAPDMLRTLAARGEHFMETDDLAATLGKKPSGGHWNSGIAVLRNNGLIEVDGRKLRAAVLLR
jgi:uncharacterized protein